MLSLSSTRILIYILKFPFKHKEYIINSNINTTVLSLKYPVFINILIFEFLFEISSISFS